MLFRYFRCISSKFIFNSNSRYFSYKKMSYVYFRYTEPSERFDITFSYIDSSVNVNRTFNLKRSITESVSDFASRIKTNVDKVINIKAKKRKKTPESQENMELGVVVNVFKKSEIVDGSKTCKEVFFSGGDDFKIKINELVYDILLNPPWIEELSLPQSLMVGSYVYPCKFNILYGSKEHCILTWYKSNEAGSDWKEVGTGPLLRLTEEFLGGKVKLVCLPGNGEVTGPEVSAVSNAVIKEGPQDMPFLLRHRYTEHSLPPGSFRVMSYNLLAEVYAETETARTELFPYCPDYARNIDYRKQLLIREIIGYNADIICLQECDVRLFNNDLTHALLEHEGELTRKSGTVAEGIATFYAKRKFRLLKKKELFFADEIENNPLFSSVWEAVKNCEGVKNNIKERSTVFHALILECLDSDKVLVVGNTHLFFYPTADHIRLLQGGMAVLFMVDILRGLQQEGKKSCLIFCGDMNSTPDCGLYKLLTEKYVPSDFKDWQSDPAEVLEGGLELRQPYEMQSAYGTPLFTNYTDKFNGCLDYIYYQSDVVKLKQTVPLPEEEVVKQHTALPSPLFPSDHLALIADFTWTSP